MKKIVLMLAAMALIAGTAQAYDAGNPGPELVTNGDFESGTFVKDAVPYGWAMAGETTTAGAYGTLVQWKGPPAAPTKIAQVTGPSYYNTGGVTIAGMIQTDIAVLGGAPHLFTFDAKCISDTSWFSVQVRWRDAEGGSLGYDNEWVGSYFNTPSGSTNSNAWFVPTVSATVTAGGWWTYPVREMRAPGMAVTADIHFYAWLGCVHQYDEISLVEIPEPLTLSLLGLGGLMLRRRKK